MSDTGPPPGDPPGGCEQQKAALQARLNDLTDQNIDLAARLAEARGSASAIAAQYPPESPCHQQAGGFVATLDDYTAAAGAEAQTLRVAAENTVSAVNCSLDAATWEQQIAAAELALDAYAAKLAQVAADVATYETSLAALTGNCPV